MLFAMKKKESHYILSTVRMHNCDFAILDLELGKDYLLYLGRMLYATNPKIQFAFVSDVVASRPLEELCPWLLELKDVSTDLALAPATQLDSQEDRVISMFQDSAKAAQHLTRLMLESSAQAALITRKNNLWAYAGQLSQDAVKELATTVTRHWDGQKGSDLLRFVRLESTKAEHILYATRLADEVVFAVVFDADKPFSTIREQRKLENWIKKISFP